LISLLSLTLLEKEGKTRKPVYVQKIG